MFTGIIEETGTVIAMARGKRSAELRIAARLALEGTKVGDSISINGVCLTATSIFKGGFTADMMAETLERSALAELRAGTRVNLERALTISSRVGGHLVSGHIDGTGTVLSVREDDIARIYRIACGQGLLRYIVEKGSVAIDGISLTVCAADMSGFAVSVIPHTAAVTTLTERPVGSLVNIECDMMAKYAERLLNADGHYGGRKDTAAASRGNLDEKFLLLHGFMEG